jgi:hypothetical protein
MRATVARKFTLFENMAETESISCAADASIADWSIEV